MQRFRTARLRTVVVILTIGFAPSLALTGCDSGGDANPIEQAKVRPGSSQVVHGIHAEAPRGIEKQLAKTGQGSLKPRSCVPGRLRWMPSISPWGSEGSFDCSDRPTL